MMELLLVVVLVGVMAAVGFAPAYTVLAIKDIKEAKAEAIANINRDFWVAEYYRHVAIDSTNTKLELDAREEGALIEALFEDAIAEERLLTDVEMQMVKEIITNCAWLHGSRAALTVLNDYSTVDVKYDTVSSETEYACTWIKFHLTAGRLK